MMKKILLGLLFVVLVAGGVGGTWYFMNMNVEAANERTNVVQAELQTTKTQVGTLEGEIKAKTDMELATAGLLANFENFSMMTGSGRSVSMLETYYDSAAVIEGVLGGLNLRTYGLALQKYWKALDANEGVKAQPVQLASGEWTAVVQLLETNTSAPITLTQSGTLVKSPVKVQQELVLVLAKWKDGKIVEQYEFPYAGDVAKSKLLEYVASTSETSMTGTGTTEKKMMGASDTSSDTPVPVEDTIIENTPAKSVPTKVETGTGTNPDAA